MIYIAIIASICAVVFLIRLLLMRREIKHMTIQLRSYNKAETAMKISARSANELLEVLAVEINETITLRSKANSEKHGVEIVLKEAISGMSHDLRTPLTSIIGYMQLMEAEDLPSEKQSEYLTIAKGRAIHLEKLINNFFALSIVDSGDYSFQLERVKVQVLVQELLLDYYDQFQAVGKQAKIDITNEELYIVTDKIACKRVIENLLLNALEHASGNISILLERQGEMAVLKISNRVHDLENLKVDRLFDRFYTADKSRSKHRGIGLRNVHSLMEQMEAEIIAEVEKEELVISCKWKLIG